MTTSLKMAETCSGFTTYSYIIAYNYTVVTGIYTVTGLTARNMDNFKFESNLIACCFQMNGWYKRK
jgi:hypothetical protein